LEGYDDINIDLVIHLGAITDTTCDDSKLLKKLNVDFSKKIWHYCTKNDIDLIYASSAATYGIGDQGFDDDEKKISELRRGWLVPKTHKGSMVPVISLKSKVNDFSNM
jgi:ADP-L-glycero-D-manno-heptose 6-epimerase